jgi:hypothetical protein
VSVANAYGRDVKKEAERIRRLQTWPHWPWLPMKRHNDGAVQIGVIYADNIDIPGDDGQSGRLVMWDAPWMPSMKAAMAISMGATPPWPIVGEYESVEQMLDDGWVVD